MTTKSFKALVGICAALAITSANAETIAYSFTNPLEVTEINQTGVLELFDTSLGTLTGATLTVTAELQTDLTLTNTASQNQLFIFTSNSDVGINSTLLAVDQLFNGSSDLSLNHSTGPVLLAPNASYVSPTLSDNQSLTTNFSTVLTALSAPGGGSFNISCESISGNSQTGGGGNVVVDQRTTAGCSAMLTYTYTPAPPVPPVPVPVGGPGMLGLLGLAMLGLVARLRRKAR